MYVKKSIWVLFVLLLAACNAVELPVHPSTQTYSPFVISTQTTMVSTEAIPIMPTKNVEGIANFESILARYKNECKAPCFLLITPDITHLEEVERILKEDLNYSCDRLAPQSLPNNIYVECFLSQYNSGLIVMSNPQTGMIDWITYFPFINQPIYLEDIIDLYDMPDGVYSNSLPDDTGLSAVSLYYDEQQMAIHLGDVKEISEFNEVSITFMGKSEYLEGRASAHLSWEGYKKLP